MRDAKAAQIIESLPAYEKLAEQVGIRLDGEKLKAQAEQNKRDTLIDTYHTAEEVTAKFKAAFELNTLMKGESALAKKPTLSSLYQKGIQPKAIVADAIEYQKLKVFEGLQTREEKDLFLLLDHYEADCGKTNQLYTLCVKDVEEKNTREGTSLRPWHSVYYPAYKEARENRDSHTLEIFDQRDHGKVLAMAESMGIKLKEVDLQEIFMRCERATRTRHIQGYLSSCDRDQKLQSGVEIIKMIDFERQSNNGESITAKQAYHAGIDIQELRKEAFVYGRECLLKALPSEEEKRIFHGLEAYEKASKAAKQTYKACLEESKAEGKKPWETEAFKDYIARITDQDGYAHSLVKGQEASAVARIAKEMRISVAALDVSAHRHSLRQTLQTYRDGDRTNVPMAAGELLNWLEFDRHGDHKHTFKVLREQDLWPDNLVKSLQEFHYKKRTLRHETERDLKQGGRDPESKAGYHSYTVQRYATYEEVETQLKAGMEELATTLFGKATSRTSTQLRFGRKGSVCVFTRGPKQGLYANHESGVFGGPLKMIEEQMGLSRKDAYQWATDWVGGNALVIEQRIVERSQEPADKKGSPWTPIIPVPKSMENPDITRNKYLNYMVKNGGKEISRHAYRDEQGNLKGYVVRIEKDDGSKMTPPLAYCENEKGFKAWKWQAFEKENKTPYGLEKLGRDPSKPILVVEGEKTADAAQKILPDYHVLTWSGGAGNVAKTNWEPLVGKEVIIWPDNDEGGHKAAFTLQGIIHQLHGEKGLRGRVGVVDLPSGIPEKWDLADELPKGWTLDTIKEMLKEALPQQTVEIIAAQKRTPQEAQVLAYLQEEIKPEKHSWLKEGYAKSLLEAAQEDPLTALERWQKVSGDDRFTPSKLAPVMGQDSPSLAPEREEALEVQNKEVLAYLQEEIKPEKHSWLKEGYAESLLKAAEDDPLAVLERWQKVSGDSSFKPSIPAALMSQDQRKLTESVLTYLKEVCPQNYKTVTEKLYAPILETAEKNPLKALLEWQKLSKDYSFNPFREKLNHREIVVQAYMQDKLAVEGHRLTEQKYGELASNLLANPLEAYQKWQSYTGDQTFDPKSGIPRLETEAQNLLTQLQGYAPPETLKAWQDNLSSSPATVLQEATQMLHQKQEEAQIASAAKEFISLSDQYEKASWHDPELKNIRAALDEIMTAYVKDERFLTVVGNSRNEAAIQRLEEEKQQYQPSLSRGMD